MMTIADAVMAGDYKNKAEVITALGELKMDLAPRFTKDAPEEAGYYWYRESNGSTIIVEVLYDNNSWMVRMPGGSMFERSNLSQGEWSQIAYPED